jgi:hypothetical protein
VEPNFLAAVSAVRSDAMEYEIDDCDALFDQSTNPSLIRRRRATTDRNVRLHSWSRKPLQRAVAIPDEEEQLA